MKSLRLLTCLFAFLALAPFAPGAEFFVFKASASVPVTRVLVGTDVDKLEKKTLSTNDFINLALGRALGTKVDAKTEVLAAQATFEDPSSAPLAKLIVFNPTSGQRTTTVGILTSLDYEVAFLSSSGKGQGIATGSFVTTTLGDPTKHRLNATPTACSGFASGPRVPGNQLEKISPTGTLTMQGKMSFRFTDKNNVTTNFVGFVTAGTFRCSGRRIGTITE